MSYKVQSMQKNTSLWQNASSGHGSEQEAIFNAKSVMKRPNIEKVRVIDSKGSVCWIS